MDGDKAVTVILGIVTAGVLGVLFILMMQRFMAEGGVFEGFLTDIFTKIFDKALGILD